MGCGQDTSTGKLGAQGQARGAAGSLGCGEPLRVGQRAPKREGGTGSGGATAAFTDPRLRCSHGAMPGQIPSLAEVQQETLLQRAAGIWS